MASPRAIAAVLAYLHELYPTREIGVATSDAWALTFADWDDETLTACARSAAATPGRVFFPTPGEIAEQRAGVAPVVNGAAILRQIEKLSAYSPQAGLIAPPVVKVREEFGALAADAYARAGAHRCFSNDETTRSIAQREFQKALEEYAAQPTQTRPLIESGLECRRLADGAPRRLESVAALVQRALPKSSSPSEPAA
jgi:hypothetical protein